MIRITSVKFQNAGRRYDFNAQDLELEPGAKVVVETDRGRTLATVVTSPVETDESKAPDGLKSILRLATEEDLCLATTNAAREKDAFKYCRERIQARQMDMKLIRAEYAFDGSKIVFYFTADGRVDFRELVKDLAHHFHTRIEMRQIGVRDEAKLVGGLGVCGRELCCCSFLTEFSPVSVKMAKEQGLALNPSKISGQCGRLLCCLSYEFETYCSLKKGMPKCGKKVVWHNQEWEVSNLNVICRELTLRAADGVTRTITMDEFKADDQPTSTAETIHETAHDTTEKPKSRPRLPRQQKKRPAETGHKDEQPTKQREKTVSEQTSNTSSQPNEGKSPSKKRRRRRPRGGRRPKPQNQGE